MIPLGIFVLGCAAIYIGTIEAAFTVLMQLPLRLDAERHQWMSKAGYLDDPVRLFLPLRLLSAGLVVLVVVLVLFFTDLDTTTSIAVVTLSLTVFVLLFSYAIPSLIVGRNPVRILELLLPSVQILVRLLEPITKSIRALSTLKFSGASGSLSTYRTVASSLQGDGVVGSESQAMAEQQDEHALLQSVVDFGDTLVREVMTPRPDIVAVSIDSDLGELRATFTGKQYSRVPVFEGSLDTIVGFVFVKDLVAIMETVGDKKVVGELLRPAHVVPQTRRVADLLKEMQREHVQSAIVHDEYGGTAGLVTIEDLLEEIVGEIRDEYDAETESIIDEGDATFVFSGRVNIDDVNRCFDTSITCNGFETVGGYVLSCLGRVPSVGEVFETADFDVEVLEAERRRVHQVRLRRRNLTNVDR